MNFAILFLNFILNVSFTECGNLKTIRGFTVAIVVFCTLLVAVQLVIIEMIKKFYEWLNDKMEARWGFRITNKIPPGEENASQNLENSYLKWDRVSKLPASIYSICFYGNIYQNERLREEIIFDDGVTLMEEYSKDPKTQKPRVLSDSELGRNFMNCFIIWLI